MQRLSLIAVALTLVVLLCAAYVPYEVSIIKWGYSGVHRAHENVSPDGSVNLQSKMNGERSAFELRPTLGTRPTQHAVTEFVEYLDDDPLEWSRMNWSAIVNGTGHYRFGVEHGPNGFHRPLIFAFEGEVGLPAEIPLQMVPDGGWPFELSDKTRAVLDCNPLPNRGTGLWLVFKDETGAWTFQRVEVGACHSGGTGYRTLRVAN